MNKVTLDFTKYPDGSNTLKVGNRGSRMTGDFRPSRTFFNVTERQIDRLVKVSHVTVSSSNGEIGWWKLWQLR
jgi:hypothetical protein